jgi:hypothetical protein
VEGEECWDKQLVRLGKQPGSLSNTDRELAHPTLGVRIIHIFSSPPEMPIFGTTT